MDTTVLSSASTKPVSVSAMTATTSSSSPHERLHSTVRVNQFTLQFEDRALETAYQAFMHRRKKALWLRALVPAAAFHILFGMGDCVEHAPDNLLVTIPARVLLAVLQISIFVLVRWDLIRASETAMLLVSMGNGLPTLLLYTLQRSSLHQWDALFVVFGLAFYTIPKITPLGFVASLVGSWVTGTVYAILAFVVRPPASTIESVLGVAYCVPVIGIFNTISYYSEYNSRERFVLRRRLRSESITLAMSRTNELPVPTTRANEDSSLRFFTSMLATTTNAKFFTGVVLWAAFTLGSWTSLPEMFKFVDEATGWAWFSHCAGVTVFLLITTRQLQWLFVVPILGAVLLWMMSLTMSAYWIIISAHSVGYGLLLASIVIAMGVFSRFVCAWRELVSFLTRSCFLYPQLQVGLQQEYPLLVKIVSEYTAGMDPEIMSSRESSNRAIVGSAAPLDVVMRVPNYQDHNQSVPSSVVTSSTLVSTKRTSPRRRLTSPRPLSTMTEESSGLTNTPTQHDVGVCATTKANAEPEVEQHCSSPPNSNKMVSVLPSFKADKCFFCSKNDAEHFVPACGMWGKWTHWRMSQQQELVYGGTGGRSTGVASNSQASMKGKPVTAMCTSYYDVQGEKMALEQRLCGLEAENVELQRQLTTSKQKDEQSAAIRVELQAELRALEEKHKLELQRLNTTFQQKIDQVLAESNRVTHQHKLDVRELDSQNKTLQTKLREAHASIKSLQDERQTIEAARTVELSNAESKEAEMASLRAELAAVRNELEATRQQSRTINADVTGDRLTEHYETTMAVQPSRRLPYARTLEIEGLRESIVKKDHEWTLPPTSY